jgi:peptidoglycan/xylan/chitin deacetylase (PgdA/CDA1 family)
MEIGAHTVNHVILGREGLVRRRSEITGSVARVQEMVGIDAVPFSYPNGQAGDFSDSDQEVMAALNVPYAVRQTPGWITPDTPRLALPRNSISRHCSDSAFLAHVLGLRDSSQFAEAQLSGIQTAI